MQVGEYEIALTSNSKNILWKGKIKPCLSPFSKNKNIHLVESPHPWKWTLSDCEGRCLMQFLYEYGNGIGLSLSLKLPFLSMIT